MKFSSITEAIFRRAKLTGDRLYIADSRNLELSGYKFLASILVIKYILEERNLGEIAIMLPTSSIGAVVNIAISSMGKRIMKSELHKLYRVSKICNRTCRYRFNSYE